VSEEHYASLMARASILVKEGRFEEAATVYVQAIEAGRKEYKEDSPQVAQALDKLSACYKTLDRHLDAEKTTHEATRIFLKLLRLKGRTLAAQQKYVDAEKEYREALRICERGFGADHAETATCLDNLATNLRVQSRYVESIQFAQRGMEIRMRVYGEDHAHTAASFANVGLLYNLLGQYEKAQELLVKSLIKREKLFGKDHLAVAESLGYLASLYRDLGRFDEAIALGERCVQIRKNLLPPEHPLTAAAIHNLALSRERRTGDAAPAVIEAAASDGGDAKPPVVVAGVPDLPPEGHRAGLWIAATLLLGGLLAGVAFWFFPPLGITIGIAVTLLGVLAMIGVVSIEALLIGLGARLRRLGGADEIVDRDTVVLGRPVPSSNGASGGVSKGGVEIEAISRKGAITALEARQLVQLGKDPLDLSAIHSLTLAAADELAKHRGTLMLNGIREVRSKLAKSLKWHQGPLELDGVPELTEAAAAHIARHEGDLNLGGLRSLPRAIAQHLAYHKGTLKLNGVRTMDEEAARKIILHKGPIQLRECRLISEETRRILRSHPHIDFPGGQVDEPGQ